MNFTTLGIVFASVLGIAGILGGVAGQLRKGVIQELRDSLGTARTEIEIEQGRSDRLEREAQLLRLEVEKLRIEVTALRLVRVDEVEIAAGIAFALSEATARLAEVVAEKAEATAAALAVKVEAVAAAVAAKAETDAEAVAVKAVNTAEAVKKELP